MYTTYDTRIELFVDLLVFVNTIAKSMNCLLRQMVNYTRLYCTRLHAYAICVSELSRCAGVFVFTRIWSDTSRNHRKQPTLFNEQNGGKKYIECARRRRQKIMKKWRTKNEITKNKQKKKKKMCVYNTRFFFGTHRQQCFGGEPHTRPTQIEQYNCDFSFFTILIHLVHSIIVFGEDRKRRKN